MATTPYSALTPRVAIHVKQCPNVVIERALADTGVEFCESSLAWRVFPTNISTISGDYTYSVSGLPTDSELSHIIYAHNGNNPLEILTVEQIAYQYPGWPDTTADALSEPRVLTLVSPLTISTVPVPDGVYTISLFVAIKPTRTAIGVEDTIVNEWLDAFVFGAVHKLLMQAGMPWADDKTAIYYGKMWRHYTLLARAKANKSLTRANLNVTMVPFA